MMVQVELYKIVIDEKRQDQIIVLKEKNGQRQFPIVIGLTEASSIRMKVSGVRVPRPLTHDLVVTIMQELGGRLECVIIDKVIKNTFHAKLHLRTATGDEKIADARPSDSIALAVRLNAPIFVAEEIIEKSAMFTP